MFPIVSLAPSASTTSTSRSARALTVTSLMRATMDSPAFGSTAHAISPQSSARAIERVPRRDFSTSTRFETVRDARGVVETRATDVIIATAFDTDDISARARVSTTSMNRETSREDTARASRDVLDDPVAPEGGETLEYVVPRIPLGDMDPKRFTDTFLARRAPVILVDAERACVPTFTLRSLAASVPEDFRVPLELERECELSAFARGDADADAYLRNLHVEDYFPDVASALRLPREFGDNLLADETRTPFVPRRWRRWFELFACRSTCAGFPFLHRDACCVHAASYQIQGRKRFTLFPPTDGAHVYASLTGNRSTIEDVDAPDVFEKYPNFTRARRLTVDVEAGEILFVPSNWWHTAKPLRCEASNDVCVSIAASFVDESVMDAFADSFAEFRAMQSLVKAGAATMT